MTIARAILADRPILVLDEALAFADAETRHALRDALEMWSADRTLLIVAHDLRSVTHADQICVIENGAVVACDRHDMLLRDSALYKALWDASQVEKAPLYCGC